MAHDKLIKVSKFYLIIGGNWPFKLSNNENVTKFYKYYCNFQLISFLCYIISLCMKLMILIVENNNPARVFSAATITLFLIVCFIKMLLLKFKKIPDLYSHVMEDEEAIKNTNDPEIKEYYEKQIKHCWLLCLSLSMGVFFDAIVYVVFGLHRLIISEDYAEFEERPFAQDLWYPFQVKAHMFVVISSSLFNVTQATLFVTYTQITLCCLMVYVTTQLKILQIRLRKFSRISREKHNGNVLGFVKQLIAKHQSLLRFVESLNKRTNQVMLLEFFTNSVGLAGVIIQLVQINSLDVLPVFSLFIAEMLQIFAVAWCANEITEAGLGIADAISSSNWSEESEEVKKLLLVMMMRAQKPIGINAGPFFRMSIDTAVSTVKIAYSYVSYMANFDA